MTNEAGSYLVDKGRYNDLHNITPKLRFKLPLLSNKMALVEALVEWIIAHSLEPVSDRGEEVVKATFVFTTVELTARLTNGVTAVVAGGFECIAGLQEYSHIPVNNQVVKIWPENLPCEHSHRAL